MSLLGPPGVQVGAMWTGGGCRVVGGVPGVWVGGGNGVMGNGY